VSLDKNTSSALMVANLIATILVIAIHYNSKGSIPSGEFWGWNYLFQELTLNGIARISVPFFAMLSGFFLASKLQTGDEYTAILKNKAKTLLLPYLIASIMIFLTSELIKWFFQPESYQGLTLLLSIESVTVHPVSDQFWFLRDLMILTILSPLLLSRNTLSNQRKYFTVLVLILFFLWLVDYQPFPIFFGWYLVSIETLFFFSLGGIFFGKKELLYSVIKTNIKNKVIVLSLWLLLLVGRIYIDPTLNVWYAKEYSIFSLALYKVAILVGIISLIQFSIYLSSNKLLIYLSGLTFFAYIFHLVPLSYIQVITSQIIDKKYTFYINYPIVLVSVFLFAHLLAKYTSVFFAIITGGRDPKKAVKRSV
jgi:surface polysaccharide O-acyltransferase-like enzyme